MAVWRVGYIAAACEFTPRALCGWNHRFDDPKREYRTVYAADKKETCLREVLADLRPDTKTLRDFEKLFGDDSAVADAGKVTVAWRAKHVLVHADIVLTSGRMTDIEVLPAPLPEFFMTQAAPASTSAPVSTESVAMPSLKGAPT